MRVHVHTVTHTFGDGPWCRVGLNITTSIAGEVQETQKAWFLWNSQLAVEIHWCTCKSLLQCGSSATECKWMSASARLWSRCVSVAQLASAF